MIPHHHNFKKQLKANKKILKLLGKLDSKSERSHKNQGKVFRTSLPSQKYSPFLKFLLLENLPIKLTKLSFLSAYITGANKYSFLFKI